MRSLAFAVAVMLALAAAIGWLLRGLDPGVVALQMAFDVRTFAEIVHRWSPQDLAAYRVHLWLDFGLLASYAAVGWLAATRTALFAGLPGLARRWAAWALPAAAAFDAGENVGHLWLTEVPRFGLHGIYPIVASLASLKWALLVAWLLTLAWALAGARSATPPTRR